MIITFDILRDDWVIRQDIVAAQANAVKLHIGQANMPTIAYVDYNDGTVLYKNYTGPGEVHVFFGHGTSANICDLQPEAFCGKLRKIPQIDRNPLLLVSCHAGKLNVAKKVAQILGVDVFAPEGSCIFSNLRYAVVNDQYLVTVSREQDRLRNLGLPPDEIFRQLTDFIQQNNYGYVGYWFTINDIHNDFVNMGFRKFTGQ